MAKHQSAAPQANGEGCEVLYAEWREDLAVRPRAWGAFFSEFRWRSSQAALFTVFAVLLPLVLFCLFPYPGGDPTTFLAMLFFATYLPLAWRGVELEKKWDAQARERLMDYRDDNGLIQVPVEVKILRGWTCIATDFGHVSVIDGFVYFGGIRTSFSLSGRSVRASPRSSRGIVFTFTRDSRQFCVRIRPLKGATDAAMLYRGREVLRETSALGAGVEVLPPTTVPINAYADAVREWTRQWVIRVILPLSPLCFFVGLMALGDFRGPIPWYLAGIVAVLAPWLPALLALFFRLSRLKKLSRTA